MRERWIRRLLGSLVLLLVVVTIVFAALQLAPGEPTDRLNDPRITPEQNLRLRQLYGLDRPLAAQYGHWLGAVISGEGWGTSFSQGIPVSTVLRRALPPTLLLALAASFVQHVLGLGLGLLAARRPGGAVDAALRVTGAVVLSMPTFWLGLLLVLVLSLDLGLFPAGNMTGSQPPSGAWQGLLDRLHHLMLPALVLGLPLAFELSRHVRNALIDSAREPFVRGARARGLPGRRIWLHHRLAHVLPPLLQLTAASTPWLLGGAVVVEAIFNWPGLGTTLLSAARSQDFPLLVAITIFSTVVVIAANWLADGLALWLDPRVGRP